MFSKYISKVIIGLLFLTSFQQDSQVWKFTRTKYVVLLAKTTISAHQSRSFYLARLIRKRLQLHLVWMCKFLPGMFWRRCCGSCTRSVGCKYSQGCYKNCYWCVAFYVNVVSSECWPIWGKKVYGICFAIAMLPCLRQSNRRPSWFVHQWK